MAADDFAILVGITQYKGLGDLKGPEGDALRFRDWLVDPAGGAVPPEHVQLIVTSAFHPPDPPSADDAEPASTRFERALRRVIAPGGGMPQGRIGRRLYLYFSGHGFTTRERPEAALYTARATLSFPDQIAGTRYLEILKSAALFEELVLVMDCCRTLEMMSVVAPPVLALMDDPVGAHGVKAFIAYGAPNGLLARERPLGPDGRVEGLLTHALLAALRLAKADEQGRITGPIVKDYIRNHWPELTQGDAIEEPEINVTHAENLVFAERSAAATPLTRVVLEAQSEPREGEVAIEDRPRSVAARVRLTQGRGEARLAPGFYKAVFDAAGRTKIFEVIGEQVDVRLDA
jgi:hypothetical protein